MYRSEMNFPCFDGFEGEKVELSQPKDSESTKTICDTKIACDSRTVCDSIDSDNGSLSSSNSSLCTNVDDVKRPKGYVNGAIVCGCGKEHTQYHNAQRLDMKDEKVRYETFMTHYWPQAMKQKPSELAKDGFFYG